MNEMNIPHDIELEKNVIGTLLCYPESFKEHNITVDDMHSPKHQRIVAAMQHCDDKGEWDISTITDRLRRSGTLELVGTTYLTSLSSQYTAKRKLNNSVKILKDKGNLRKAIEFADLIQQTAVEGGDTGDVIEQMEKFMNSFRDAGTATKFTKLSESLNDALKEIEKAQERGGEVGLQTGLYDLDKYINGLEKQFLYVIAGRPSSGKTSFGMQLAMKSAENGIPVGFFSLEMGHIQLALRLLAKESGINMTDLRKGNFKEWRTVTNAASILSRQQLFCYDVAGEDFISLANKARYMKREHKVQLIVFDYLQLIGSFSKRDRLSRYEAVSRISNGMKNLAKELNIPIIALAQLSRSCEQRENKVPIMSDLRDSGEIEQDADVIMMIYREAMYNNDPAVKHRALINLCKNRHGEAGHIPLIWNGSTTSFRSLAHE